LAKTKLDVQNYVLQIIDESTKKGVAIAPSKNADYRSKLSLFLDTAQKYIAGIIKIPAVYEFTQNPIPNMIGDFNGFDLFQVLPGTPKVFTLTGCKSAYFQMDNLGVCVVAVNGSTVQTITNTVKRQYTAYQVLTGATSSDSVTFTFTATYPFNIRNTGFYAYAFALTTDIPVYAPYVSYDMPSDFLEFDSVIIKSDPRIYASYIAHKWENNKKIIVNYYDKGSFDIHYYRYPATIASDAADNTVLDIEDKAFEVVALQCAIMATASDNPALSSWIRSLYVEKIQNISQKEQPIMNSIQTVYSMS
jgi:hypothetical protein